jgi:opacity protein-like surface antigen
MQKFVIAALMLLAPMTVSAQDLKRSFRSYGYGLTGFSSWNVGTLLFPAGSSGTDWHLGMGGEARIIGNLGIGAEIRYVHCTKCYGSTSDFTHGLMSANTSYHFPLSNTSKFLPFVTAGYSVWWSPGVNMFNVGGGIDYWFSHHVGLKVGFREHIAAKRDSSAPTTGVLTVSPRISDFHFGITFR